MDIKRNGEEDIQVTTMIDGKSTPEFFSFFWAFTDNEIEDSVKGMMRDLGYEFE